MGYASLGFSKGPSLRFRIDPTSISYQVQVFSNVIETVGGRCVQITGSQISDLTIAGDIGENHGLGKAKKGETEHPGVSWKLAEQLFSTIQGMMRYQTQGSSTITLDRASVLRPALFTYSPQNWRFPCYIKSVVDPDGDGQAGVAHKVGRANYRYVLTLFPVQEGSTSLLEAGMSANGHLDKVKQKAIDAYIGRISQGIGWRLTAFNGGANVTLSHLSGKSPSSSSSTTPTQPSGGGKPRPLE